MLLDKRAEHYTFLVAEDRILYIDFFVDDRITAFVKNLVATCERTSLDGLPVTIISLIPGTIVKPEIRRVDVTDYLNDRSVIEFEIQVTIAST
ncbi:MAG: hypothetical protein ACRC62_15260 [Microcoleus sp.]